MVYAEDLKSSGCETTLAGSSPALSIPTIPQQGGKCMRTTQYIGLTGAGAKFVSKLRPLNVPEHKTTGMFGEDVPLGTWTDGIHVFKEIVQLKPWSSGPMIFTCIEAQYFEKQRIFEWMEDFNVIGEFNQPQGTYYV